MLTGKGLNLPDVFRDFAAANARPVGFYEEGAQYDAAARAATFTLTAAAPNLAQQTRTIDHLAANVVSLKAGTGVIGPGLLVTVDLPDAVTGARAMLVSTGLPGPLAALPIDLDSTGAGTLSVPFVAASEVLLVLSNGSASFKNCAPFSDKGTACGGGTPNHDDQAFKFTAAVTDVVGPLPTPTPTGTAPPPTPTPTPEPSPTETAAPTSLSIGFLKDGRTLLVGGELIGADPGNSVSVTLSRKKNGKFRKVASSSAQTDEDLFYVVAFNRPKAGKCKAVAKFAGDATHLPSQATKSFSC